MAQAAESTSTPLASQRRRPWSISIIAVLSILYGVATLIPKLFLFVSPEAYQQSADLMEAMTDRGLLALPMGAQLAISLLGSLICVIAGIFLWRGRDWARWLVLAWVGLSLVMYLLLAGLVITFYLKLPVAVLLIFFLTRRRSAAYFRPPA